MGCLRFMVWCDSRSPVVNQRLCEPNCTKVQLELASDVWQLELQLVDRFTCNGGRSKVSEISPDVNRSRDMAAGSWQQRQASKQPDFLTPAPGLLPFRKNDGPADKPWNLGRSAIAFSRTFEEWKSELQYEVLVHKRYTCIPRKSFRPQTHLQLVGDPDIAGLYRILPQSQSECYGSR
ncbi:hypothetical protein G7K_4445-t1 [Saitoella complicata NRRL Y-17804]|uniref:Uncharacterized protein n=1 Tax=Saitoella complicata (strain BCRC 22490 / CBS 7301 / JCM 7358 / NBRC 10748 / NRRL Y-17804) TaxID=698492 RepID=A0A0E9NLM6_SAICN|nr:hypothetical protein G7K_4445-t1 [Saitoella complicata NRRL Y-17804]